MTPDAPDAPDFEIHIGKKYLTRNRATVRVICDDYKSRVGPFIGLASFPKHPTDNSEFVVFYNSEGKSGRATPELDIVEDIT